jgi:DNA (cytosine-5)-methyltransferase 1
MARRLGVSVRQLQRWEKGEVNPPRTTLEVLRRMVPSADEGVMSSAPITFVDLFAGIGGMRLGFEAIGGRCVFTCEIDRFSRQTYTENFGTAHAIASDIREVSAADIPEHDILLAGFPCQPFSIAGVSKKNALGRPHGFECETQGTLFREIERILAGRRPQAFLLENVKNLVSHDHGRTYRTIMHRLQDVLGYRVFPMVVNARPFVPQHRERIFLVGFRDPVRFDWDSVIKPITTPVLGSILHPEDGSEPAEPPYTEGRFGTVNPKYTLTDHLWRYLRDYAEKHRAKGNGFGYGLVGPDSVARTLSARYHKDGSEILVTRATGNPRRLTPRECARLMGFDRRDRRFRIPVSDTQAYRQFGNAVVVPVVTEIARAMRPHIAAANQLSLVPLLESA